LLGPAKVRRAPGSSRRHGGSRRRGQGLGRPHFTGGDGGTFDVQGKAGKTYNLLSDSGLKWHGTCIGDKPGITRVGQTLLEVVGAGGCSRVVFDSVRNQYKVNGKRLSNGQCIVLADGGTAQLKGCTLTVKTRDGKRGKGAQGEGAIDGVVTDYEVAGFKP
jgi:hypothetical protein